MKSTDVALAGSPDVRRVSAKRHLTVDTVPVTLLDIHLECDKVDLIIFFWDSMFLFCRLWHRGAIALALHRIQISLIGNSFYEQQGKHSSRKPPKLIILQMCNKINVAAPNSFRDLWPLHCSPQGWIFVQKNLKLYIPQSAVFWNCLSDSTRKS